MHLIINVWIRDGKIVRKNVLNPYEHSEMGKETYFLQDQADRKFSVVLKYTYIF